MIAVFVKKISYIMTLPRTDGHQLEPWRLPSLVLPHLSLHGSTTAMTGQSFNFISSSSLAITHCREPTSCFNTLSRDSHSHRRSGDSTFEQASLSSITSSLSIQAAKNSSSTARVIKPKDTCVTTSSAAVMYLHRRVPAQGNIL